MDMEGPLPGCRARSVPLSRAVGGGNAPTSRHAEPADGSDVELDVVLEAARRHGASRVVYHNCMFYFDSWQGRSIVHSNVVQVHRRQRGRTARQRRSAARNTRAAYEQRRATREQRENSTTAEVGSTDQTQPAAATTAAGADGGRSAATVANGMAEQLARPPGLAPLAAAAPSSSPPSPKQQPEVECQPEEAPAPVSGSDNELAHEALSTAAAAAEAAAAATTTAATTTPPATAMAAASVAADEAAGMAAPGEAVGVDERRAEATGAGKRQAVAVTTADNERIVIDVGEAAVGAPSRAGAGAPYRARAGTQCEGRCAGGLQCQVRSVGSSAPTFVSAPLRLGGRFCTVHDPRRVAARAAKAATAVAKAKAKARRQQPARGIQRIGAARRAAEADSGTAGMAAVILAARRA